MADWGSAYERLGLDVARYLAARGVVRDPEDDQQAPGDLPAVVLGQLHELEGGEAVGVIGPWEVTRDLTDSNPVVRFVIVLRSEPWDYDGLAALTKAVFGSLHRRERFSLTAEQSVETRERIVSDPPTQDQNRRWLRAETYQLRLRVPTT